MYAKRERGNGGSVCVCVWAMCGKWGVASGLSVLAKNSWQTEREREGHRGQEKKKQIKYNFKFFKNSFLGGINKIDSKM